MRGHDQRSRCSRSALAVAAIAAAAALGAAPSPDAHDRALARQLDAKVQTFRKIAAQDGGSDELKQSLDKCPLLKKDPGQAFAALFALLPALLTQIVNDYGPRSGDVQRTVSFDAPPRAALPAMDQGRDVRASR